MIRWEPTALFGPGAKVARFDLDRRDDASESAARCDDCNAPLDDNDTCTAACFDDDANDGESDCFTGPSFDGGCDE